MEAEHTPKPLLTEQLTFKLSDQNELLKYYSCFQNKDDFLENIEFDEAMNCFVKSIDSKLNSLEELLAEVKNIESFNRVCGKAISSDEVFYMCLDCDILTPQKIGASFSLQCKDCFEKANHEGHKVTNKTSSGTGVCDCGDPTAWDPKGFCPAHPGYSKQRADAAYNKIPEYIRKGFLSSLQVIFYSLFDHLETNSDHGWVLQNIVEILAKLHELQDCFKLLTIEFLMSTVPDNFKLRVNLENLVSYRFKPNPAEVDCVYAELLARYDLLFSQKLQGSIRHLLLELFVHLDFKEFYIKLYAKLVHFFFYMGDFNDPEPRYSECANFYLPLLMAERFGMIATSVPTAVHFIDVVTKIVNPSKKFNERKLYSMCFYASMNLKYLFDQQNPSEQLFKQPGFMKKIFEMMEGLASLDAQHDIDSFLQHCKTTTHSDGIYYKTFLFARIMELLEPLYARIFSIGNTEVRQEYIDIILREFVISLEQQLELVSPPDFETFALFPKHFHALGLFLMMWYRHSNSLEEFKNSVYSSLSSSSISKERFHKVAEYVFQRTIILLTQTLALQRVKHWLPKFKEISDYLQNYFQQRMSPKYQVGNIEICLVQILSNFNPEQDWLSTLAARVVSRGVFYPREDVKLGLTVLFFESVGFIFSDIISFFNLIQSQSGRKVHNPDAFAGLLLKIERRVVVNYLQMIRQTGFSALKEDLKTILTFKTLNSLETVATYDAETQKIRLKDSCKGKEVMMKLFYLQARFDDYYINTVTENPIKAENFDPILGNTNLEQLNPLINNQLFGDVLLQAVALARNVAEEEKFKTPRRLLYFFAHQIDQLKRCPTKQRKQIFDKEIVVELPKFPTFEAMFDEERAENESMTMKTKFSLREDFIKAVQSIEVVYSDQKGPEAQKLLGGTLSELLAATYKESMQEEEEKISTNTVALSDDAETRKKEILAKQKALREQFMKKQHKFMNQHGNGEPEEQSETKHTKETTSCVFCHEPLDDKEQNGYGFLAYTYESNYFSHCQKRKLKELAPKRSEKPSLSFNSCFHMLHINCIRKLRETKTFNAFKMNSEIELTCPLCKSLTNLFIYSLEGEKIEEKDEVDGTELSFKFSVASLEEEYIASFKGGKDMEEIVDKTKLNNVNEFFSELGIVLALSREMTGDMDQEFPDPVEVLADAVIMSILKLDLVGLKLFLNKKLPIIANIARAVKISLASEKNDGKKLIEENLAFLMDLNVKSTSGNHLKKFVSSIQQKDYLQLIWRTYLVERSIDKANFKKFFQQILLVDLAFEFMKLFYEDLQMKCSGDIKEIASGLTFKNFHESLLENLYCGLPNVVSILRMFVSFGLALDIYDDKKIESANLVDNELSMISFLYGIADKQKFSEAISVFLNENKAFYESVLHKLPSEEMHLLFENLDPNQHAMISLPAAYYDFKTSIHKAKCTLCNSISKNGYAICLICGELRCISKCDSIMLDESDTVGNLNKHAREEHNGVCAFMGSEYSTVLLVNTPKNVSRDYLYTGKFGQQIEPTKSDWHEFIISQPTLNKLRQTLALERIPQEIYHTIEITQRKIKDNYY